MHIDKAGAVFWQSKQSGKQRLPSYPAICLTGTVFFIVQVSTACCCLFPCEGTPWLGLLMSPGGGHLPGGRQALSLLAALQQLQCIVEFSKSAA